MRGSFILTATEPPLKTRLRRKLGNNSNKISNGARTIFGTHRHTLCGRIVIRNRKTSTVLHMEHADAKRDGSHVSAFKQDENNLKDQQIWWIEPLADYGSEDSKPEEGLVYSITNPASGRSLDINPGDENVCTWVHHGRPWQRWRLKKVIEGWQGEVCYNIVNVFNDKVVDTVGDNPPPGARVTGNRFASGRHEHYWDLLIPVVAFPSGWLHIQNVGTGDLLRQNYVYNSPILLPPPTSPKESQHLEGWEFQWTLAHSKCFEPSTADEINSWYIVNRRIRAHLSPHFGNIKPEHAKERDEGPTWELELGTTCNWKIINRRSGCLLQSTKTPFNSGVALDCSNKRFVHTGGSQSWILKPPSLHIGNESLPKYEDTNH